MMFRSILFVPADSERKLEKSLTSEADALIFDLEDSVAPDRKASARAILSTFLQARAADTSKALYIRVNDLSTGLLLDDLVSTIALRPAGYVLPKCRGQADLETFSRYLEALEVVHGLPAASIGIIPIVTETAESVLGLGSYRGAAASVPTSASTSAATRLHALMWGAEDLSADLGATGNRAPDGRWSSPFMLARSLCLLAAAQAGVPALDTISVEILDVDAVRIEAEEARRDGFQAKAAIHPGQVAVINQTFVPTASDINWAHQALAAVAAAGGGVAKLNGQMLDAPHLKRARAILERGVPGAR